MTATSHAYVLQFPKDRISEKPSDPAKITIREAYNLHLKPKQEVKKRAPNTFAAYANTLNIWEKFTDNPLLDEVTNDTVEHWEAAMHNAGYSEQTIAKNWRHLRAIFRRCGPKLAHRNGAGKDLIHDLPYLEIELTELPPPDIATAAEVSAMYKASHKAKWPQGSGASPELVWQCIWVLEWNYGLRTSDFVELTWKSIDLKAEQLRYVPRKTRRRKPFPIQLPLNAVTLAHFRALNEANGNPDETQLVFPFPVRRNTLHKWRLEIQKAAGLLIPYTFQQLRATCNSNYEAMLPGVGAHILGHAKRGVNQQHYLNTTKTNLLKEAVDGLEQPEAFLSGP